jgi:RimJ/RimL family protein N-acetyltransferase
VRQYKSLRQAEFTHGDYTLTGIRDEDKYAIMKWRNEQIDILRQKEPLTTRQQENYFKNVVDKLFDEEQPDQLLFSFLEKGRVVGYGGLVHIDWTSGNGEISFITETSRNVSAEQFKRDWSTYLHLLKRLTQINLRFFKIYTYAYDIRPLLIEMLLENGFREEARLHKHILVSGALRDVLIHSYFFDDVSLRDATEDDMMMYFEWANDPQVRSNSFNEQPIPVESHRKWFANKLKSNGTLLFVCLVNDIPVGQIRFDEAGDESFEIDFSIDSAYRGRQLGHKILIAGVRALAQRKPNTRIVKGKVKDRNEASKRSFVSAGFLDSGQSDGVVSYLLANPGGL